MHNRRQILAASTAALGGSMFRSYPSMPIIPVLSFHAEEHEEMLKAAWEAHFNTGVSVQILDRMLSCMTKCDHALPYADSDTRAQIRFALWGYNWFLARLMRDRNEYGAATIHLRVALEHVSNAEEQATVAWIVARNYIECGYPNIALAHYESTGSLFSKLSDYSVNCCRLEGARALAKTAQTQQEKTAALRLIDQAGNMIRGSGAQPYNLRLDLNRFHLYKAMILMDVGSNNSARKELALVKPTRQRIQAEAWAIEAESYLNEGNYGMATSHAIASAEVAIPIKSHLEIAHVKRIHKALQETAYGKKSDVKELEYSLYGKEKR